MNHWDTQGAAIPESFSHGQPQLHTLGDVAQRQMYALQTHFQQSHIHSESLVPVHRLPPHLLVRIFNHLSVIDHHRLDDPPTLDDCARSFDRNGLFIVMLVCRRWYEIAMNFTPFWTHIDLDVVKHPDIFIRRSLGVPLSFHFSIDKPNLNLKLSFLEQCGPLVQSLFITCDSGPVDDDIALPLGWRVPEVKSLVMSLSRSSDGAERLAEWFARSIPKAQLQGLAICASVNHVTWPTEPLPQLTHLFLEFSDQYEDYSDGVAGSLLKLLTRAPLLEHIHLRYHSRSSLALQSDLPVVSLDHVRSITLYQFSVQFVLGILHHLSLPDHVLLCMSDLQFDADSDDEDAEPPDLDQLRFPPLSLFRNLTFMELSIYDHHFNCSANNAQQNAGYLLTAYNFYHWHLWVELTLPLTQIRVLHLNLDDVVSIERLPQIIANFVLLEQLFVVSCDPDMYGEETVLPLLDALTETLAQTSPVVCAELHDFGLESDIPYDEFPFDKLAHMLEARLRAGCPLTRFVYQCRDLKFDDEETLDQFENAIAALNVETAEYLPYEVQWMCPFQPNKECWDNHEAQKYWLLPKEHKELEFDMPWGKFL